VAGSIKIAGDGKIYTFENQIEIRSRPDQPFSQPGDGGAAVFDPKSGRIIGIVIAGGLVEDAHITCVSPLAPIFAHLAVELIEPGLPIA
jgi:hypothetical protein